MGVRGHVQDDPQTIKKELTKGMENVPLVIYDSARLQNSITTLFMAI